MKKIRKDMFLWSKTSIVKGLDVHFQKNDDSVSKIIVLVPKRVVGLAVERNNLRRRVKEMFRKKGFKILKEKKVQIELDGGVLNVDWREDGVWMTGPTMQVFTGSFSKEFLKSL